MKRELTDLTKILEVNDVVACRGEHFAKIVAINPSKTNAIIALIVDPISGEGETVKQYYKNGKVSTQYHMSKFDLDVSKTVHTVWVSIGLDGEPKTYKTEYEARADDLKQLARPRKVLLAHK